MRDILEQANITITGKRRYSSEPLPYGVSLSTRKIESESPCLMDEYVLEMLLRVNFHANQAQYRSALADARNLLRRGIYADLEASLAAIRLAAREGAMREVCRLTYEIESGIGYESTRG